jgi:hypothetical protein
LITIWELAIMNTTHLRWLAPLLLLCAAFSAHAQSLQKSVAGSGYTKIESHKATINGTIGQAIVGSLNAPRTTTSQGFWTGGGSYSVVVKPGQYAPHNVNLLSNSPNPFSNATTIRFTLLSPKDIELRVFAANGDLVNTTKFVQCNAGPSEYVFPRGVLPSGNYNYTLSDGTSLTTGAMTITK